MTPPTPTSVSIRAINRRLFRGSVLPTALAVAVAAVAAGVLGDRRDWIAVVFAGSLVVAFFGVALWVSSRTSTQHAFAVMAAALTAYTIEIVGLGITLLLFRHTTLFHPRTFAFSMLGAAAVWLTAQVITFLRMKIPTIDPLATGTGGQA